MQHIYSQPIHCLGRSDIGRKFIINSGYLAALTMIYGQNNNSISPSHYDLVLNDSCLIVQH